MTLQETVEVMAILELAYPNFYAKADGDERAAAANMWQMVFQDEPYDLIKAAVLALIKTRTSTFPPVPGEVTQMLQRFTEQGGMTEMEAWGLVSRALRNSGYDSAGEFQRLPGVVQRAVGSPLQLKIWAGMEEEEVQTVVSSNFMRCYKVFVQREKDMIALPVSIRTFLEGTVPQILKQLPGEQ